MWDKLNHRYPDAECMDDFSSGGKELREALRYLRVLNRLFFAARPTLYGVKRLWAESGQPSKLSILDVGAGSGDVNRSLLQWADVNRVDVRIELIDITVEACSEANLMYANEPRVRVTRGDLFSVPDRCADIVTAAQFVHHFSDEHLPYVFRTLLRASRIGVVVNDIHRHPVAWAAVWLATHVLSRNRYIRHDGPLSVAKGFRATDWQRLRLAMPEVRLMVRWRPLFRYAAVAAALRE